MIPAFLRSLVLPTLLAGSAIAVSAHAERIVLPTDVTPDHYELAVTPEAGPLTFTGRVRIDLTVHKATSRIVLNDADIVIDKASLSGETAAPVVSYDDKQQTAAFAFTHALAPGHYALSLDYHGKIYQQASGLFASDYQTAGRRQAGAVHPVRELRRAPLRALLGRAGAQGDLRPDRDGAGRPDGRVQHAGRRRPTALPGGLQARALRRQRRRCRPTCCSSAWATSSACIATWTAWTSAWSSSAATPPARPTRSTPRRTSCPTTTTISARPTRCPSSTWSPAPGGSQFFGAMENWGAIFYFERDLLVDPRVATEDDRQDVYRHRRARDGAPVVRRPGDHGLVGRPVAQRGLRLLDGEQGHRPVPSGMEALAAGTGRASSGAMHIDARDGTHPDHHADRRRAAGRRRLRHHHLFTRARR